MKKNSVTSTTVKYLLSLIMLAPVCLTSTAQVIGTHVQATDASKTNYFLGLLAVGSTTATARLSLDNWGEDTNNVIDGTRDGKQRFALRYVKTGEDHLDLYVLDENSGQLRRAMVFGGMGMTKVGVGTTNVPLVTLEVAGTLKVSNIVMGVAQATGLFAVAIGGGAQARGEYSYVHGSNCIAEGPYSRAEGFITRAYGWGAHAAGVYSIASNTAAYAEGYSNMVWGSASHAEGAYNICSGSYSHVEGAYNVVGTYAHAEGHTTRAIGMYSHSEGRGTIAAGMYSHAEGYATAASNIYSHAEGFQTLAAGTAAHAAGANARATNNYTYVWSDGSAFSSTATNQFSVYAGGGIRLLGGPVTIARSGDLSMGSFTNMP